MSSLAAPLSLHDVDDVEALARRALDDRLKAWGARLRPADYEDFLQYLIGEAWQLSGRYDPTKGLSFATHCYRILKLRVADCYRHYFGDTRHGPRPVVLSLDAPVRGAGNDLIDSLESDALGRGDRLDEALASSAGDPAEHCSPDLARVLEARGGGSAGPLEAVREPKARGAGKGARRARTVSPRVPGMYVDPDPPPRCTTRCLPVFRKAFVRANKARPEADRLTLDQIEEMALTRSEMVRFRSEWICPRCTTIGAGVDFKSVYPNREARRRAGKA